MATAFFATAVWTPAAAAYSANDVLSTVQTLTWRNPRGEQFDGGELMLLSSKLTISTTALQSSEGQYKAALYNVTPPSALADNAAWDVPSGDRDAFQTLLDLGTPVDLGSTLRVDNDGINKVLSVLPGGLTYAYLVTIGGFTATAVARTLRLHAISL
jgi:hypothetical protein